MAASVVVKKRNKFGNGYAVTADVTLDDSYPTGGEALTAKQFGLAVLNFILPSPAAGYIFEFDHDNSKLKAFTPVKAQAAHSHVNTLTPTAKTLRLVHAGADIKGSANTDSENADADALPTNGALVGAETAVADAAYAFPATANPDMGRNVCIVFHNDSGGPLNLFEGVMTFTVTGTYRGAAQTEDITFTSDAGNKAMATAKYRYKYGVKQFDTVTDVTVDNICDNAIKIAVGIGSKIGLPTDLKTPSEADVVKITKNAADLAVAGTVDVTNMTVNLGALADNDDFEIVYEGVAALTGVAISNVTGGAISADAAAEVVNESNLSAVTARVLAIGY
ncbi:hypothetical protein [Phosphitispora fastidiosa]|uniref:hypothetical protein n=1 Tax=Phosphitispora fastidiosa TaxID=2837202 RepID=UPI001E55FC06|nr:hypothetical protein [Phosphitispora fastidiosa]MBU7006306.1 hypothetical protein [Phosphitispora fastidiosa]